MNMKLRTMLMVVVTTATNLAYAQTLSTLSQHLCPSGKMLVTGTPYNRIQLQQGFGSYLRADLIQAAALIAAVPEQNKAEVRWTLERAMQTSGKWNQAVDEILFPMLVEDAENANRGAEALRVITRDKLAGLAVGAGVGLAVRKITNIPGTGLVSGVIVGNAARNAVKAAATEVILHFTQDIADALVRNPCTMTAAEALEQAKRP